jgi:hypothetical protein
MLGDEDDAAGLAVEPADEVQGLQAFPLADRADQG